MTELTCRYYDSTAYEVDEVMCYSLGNVLVFEHDNTALDPVVKLDGIFAKLPSRLTKLLENQRKLNRPRYMNIDELQNFCCGEQII